MAIDRSMPGFLFGAFEELATNIFWDKLKNKSWSAHVAKWDDKNPEEVK